MNDMRDMFDQEMRKRLSGYKESPDENLWMSINARVSPPNPASTVTASAQWLTAILSAIPLGVLLYVVVNTNGNKVAEQAAAYKHSAPVANETHQPAVVNEFFEMAESGLPALHNHRKDSTRHAFIGRDQENTANPPVQVVPPSLTLTTGNSARKFTKSQNMEFPADKTAHGSHEVTRSSNEAVRPSDRAASPRDTGTHLSDIAMQSSRVLLVEEFSGEEQQPAVVEDKGLPVASEAGVYEEREKAQADDAGASVSEIVLAKEKRQRKKFLQGKTFYLLAMPTMGYNRFEANTNDNVFVESIERLPNFSLKRLGLRMEVGMQVPITDRLQLNIGIVYYQRKQTLGYVLKELDSMNVVTLQDSTVTLEPAFAYRENSFDYKLKNIGGHVALTYVISRGTFLHSIGTGLEAHKGLSKPTDELEAAVGGDPSAYLFYNLYYRVQYPTEGRLKAIFQPTLNYSFYVNKDFQAPFYVKPYGLGLNLGITYNF